MKSWQAKSLLLFGTSIWGATFLFTQIGITYCSPSFYLVIRFAIALLLCFSFFGKHIVKITKQRFRQGALLGIFWAVGFLLQTFGLKYTSIGNAAFITNLTIGLSPFIYWFITRDKIKIHSKVAMLIGFIGINIIADTFGGKLNWGDVLIVISTFMWSSYMSCLHIFTKGTQEMALNAQLTAVQFLVGLPILLVYWLAFELNTFYFELNSSLVVSLLFNAVMASFLVSFIQISVQKYTTPVNAALIFAMEPIFASIIAYFVLHETLTPQGYIGAVCMLIAIFVSDTWEVVWRKIRHHI